VELDESAFLNLSRSPIDGFRSAYGKVLVEMEGILPVEKFAKTAQVLFGNFGSDASEPIPMSIIQETG